MKKPKNRKILFLFLKHSSEKQTTAKETRHRMQFFLNYSSFITDFGILHERFYCKIKIKKLISKLKFSNDLFDFDYIFSQCFQFITVFSFRNGFSLWFQRTSMIWRTKFVFSLKCSVEKLEIRVVRTNCKNFAIVSMEKWAWFRKRFL